MTDKFLKKKKKILMGRGKGQCGFGTGGLGHLCTWETGTLSSNSSSAVYLVSKLGQAIYSHSVLVSSSVKR